MLWEHLCLAIPYSGSVTQFFLHHPAIIQRFNRSTETHILGLTIDASKGILENSTKQFYSYISTTTQYSHTNKNVIYLKPYIKPSKLFAGYGTQDQLWALQI